MEFPGVVFAKVNIERGKVCMRGELTASEVHCHSRTYDFSYVMRGFICSQP